MAEYELTDSEVRLTEAIEVLSCSNPFFFDCEGDNLGGPGGTLSILSCRSLSGKTYLIDALAFTESQLLPLLQLLSNEAIHKVVWDGRMDYSELWHGQNTKLNGVLDLQLADVVSRKHRGEGQREQFIRLVRGRYLNRAVVFGNPNEYVNVQRLNGLDGASREHGVLTAEDDHAKKASKPDHTQWCERPLPRNYLSYAASDVLLISNLYRVFCEKNYIEEPTLLRQSATYISFHHGARPEGSTYTRHSLLPLDILNDISEPKDHCVGCYRQLSASYFLRGSSDGFTDSNESRCPPCHALFRRWEIDQLWS